MKLNGHFHVYMIEYDFHITKCTQYVFPEISAVFMIPKNESDLQFDGNRSSHFHPNPQK